MSGLSTKNIQNGGGGLPKSLQPGNRVIKVEKIYLEAFPFREGGFHILLDVLGADLGPDFDGFFIDNNNQALGKHNCQVGRVKASEWAFADASLPGGIEIKRNDEILKFVKNLCEATGCEKWLDDADGKYDTIEDLVAGFNTDKPFANKFINTCLAGREYQNKQGYTQYDLFFPKFTRAGIPFEAENTEPSRVSLYNPETHIKRKKAKEVADFEGGTDATADGGGAADFDI